MELAVYSNPKNLMVDFADDTSKCLISQNILALNKRDRVAVAFYTTNYIFLMYNKREKMLINFQDIPDQKGSNYPDEFSSVVTGRSKKRLGDAAGLQNFGVTLVKLAPEIAGSPSGIGTLSKMNLFML